MIEHTGDGRGSVGEFKLALLARIEALMRAHTLLGRSDWRGVTIGDLVTDQLSPYANSDSIRVEGPEIVLNGDATQALSMAVHELATNAVKHGQGEALQSHGSAHRHGGPARRCCSNGASRGGPK